MHLSSRFASRMLLSCAGLLCILQSGCGGSGSGSGSGGGSAPSNLTYPQTSINATAGTAIAQDTPTVSGTVAGYTVSPALPAGLALNATTGTISGTPTAASAQATYAVTAFNSGGSTTAVLTITVALAAPSNLVYPQTSITATVGTAITPDTPTVSGTVASYSVAPALPAGLTLDATTGTISGTPSAGTPQATYTVTATNAAGSTAATWSITVLAAPSQLVYPQAAIYGTVGFAISADSPTVSGTVESYSANPALPAGLTLDPALGTIVGTPTAASPKATYTITASDSVGSTTAQITITVAAAPTVLLDLGHQVPVTAVQLASDRLLSLDQSGDWIFWGYTAASILASGDGATGLVGNPNQAPLTGQFFAVSTATQIQLYAITDGHSLASIPFSVAQGQSWAQIASDGSYLCTGNASGLTVWSPDGQSELTVAGDYHAASPYAAPGQVQIANGPAGANVIQTISVPSGGTSTGPQFSGSFNSWFLDGQSFFTNMSNNVWIYSTAGTQEAFLTTLASSRSLMGNGNLFWQGTSVYSVSSGSLIQAYPTTGANLLSWSSGTTIAILVSFVGSTDIQIVDLSGATPTAMMQPVDLGLSSYQWQTSLPVFAAQNSQVWVLAGQVIFDGLSLSGTTPRCFGYGEPSSTAGAPNLVALSTTTGIHFINPSTGTVINDSCGFIFGNGTAPEDMALSTDGSVLTAYDSYSNGAFGTPTLTVSAVPSMSTIGSFTFPQTLIHPFLVSFSLSGSGTNLGQVVAEGESLIDGGPFTRQVTGVSGTPTIWSDSDDGALVLSPDGTLVAATNEPTPTDGNGVTSIYQNGTLVTTVSGYAEGWIDNSRLLVSNFSNATTPAYLTSAIYSATGQTLFTFPSGTVPQISNPQFTSANSVYDPGTNAVYSLADGSIVWKGPLVSYGALADPYVVFPLGHQVLLAQY